MDEHTTTSSVALEAIAQCAYCPWRAKLRGFDAIDVGLSLRKILIEHVAEVHPEHNAYGRIDWRGPQR